jgi:hypothetical protein
MPPPLSKEEYIVLSGLNKMKSPFYELTGVRKIKTFQVVHLGEAQMIDEKDKILTEGIDLGEDTPISYITRKAAHRTASKDLFEHIVETIDLKRVDTQSAYEMIPRLVRDYVCHVFGSGAELMDCVITMPYAELIKYF